MEQFSLEMLDKQKGIHMIGIGGVSMSALAYMLKSDGFTVTGSDFKESVAVESLMAAGIPVVIGHSAENIKCPAAVVYTAAIPKDNPELLHAQTLGIPVVERSVLLGALMKRYHTPIAVSGTHGKTTTTSMLSQVLLDAGLDPTILVGGVLPSIGSNLYQGKNDFLVMEACEYSRSFLDFYPRISIILNVEADHLDYYKDLNEIIESFHQFAEKTPDDGALIVNGDDVNARAAVKDLDKKILFFSVKDETADFYATDICFNESGFGKFTVLKNGKVYTKVELAVPGLHNVMNALSVIAAADLLGVPPEKMQKGLSAYCGTKRRFELRGVCNGARVIDDYAHHPTEIMATLKTARSAGRGKILCVFQPHTYTRAYKLKDEFAQSFADCDLVLVVDIYAAREKDTGLINSAEIAEKINEISHNAKYVENFEAAETVLRAKAQPGDFIITLGAGDVNKIAANLVQ